MHTTNSAVYLPLIGNNPEDIDTTSLTNRHRNPLRALLVPGLLAVSISFNLVLLAALVLGLRDSSTRTLYSPAHHAVEYKTVKFHSGFGADLPIYDRPPSPEVDAAWDGLYEFALNKVPREEAILMPNRTYPILGEEDHYMIALDVFHQLHCLNEMRKAMYPEYYPITGEGIHTPHMQHCISSLRQSITCSSDITPIVWQWSNKSQAAKERSDVVHTCRDFEKIKDWAHDHFVPRQQNMSIFINDDLKDIPASW
ncbi:hypothetical protein F5878DRAFT_70349 [Lentinula raphanica]|uniref:Tat pathway signal sequence n=1 Tax=Lentinula raphanica TaxID=153919 RepID=A0AA38PCL3_9AGAR|nr:hypothetical protein C8R42DRAFT_70094 [Lentinula raphanica]KAJ3826027.1 hypothetical protein F5880DRAFT_154323 [Lentinula raphanica]KAJ3840440.1 hypothetical protein F5878DRAFT_70349 [Lentinula raphanica]